MPLLNDISFPSDLRKLQKNQLPQVCDELRGFIIEAVSHNPGHLGSSLGVIELTVALHYVFNTPNDKIVWDVGHQAYPHKILTGRKERFHTNRKYRGISGFPKMSESEYDAFGTGHSSTSISATLGMAVASERQGEIERQHIAVIGDGALTGGMSFEALNHAGVERTNILVIVNDNGIAIDKNVGGLSKYFTQITSSKTYNRVRNRIWNLLGGNSEYHQKSKNYVRRFFAAIKALLFKKGNLFESLGFRYFGPIDGNDVESLVKTLNDLKNIKGPKILHIATKKGKGLSQAENHPTLYHAPGTFDYETGEIKTDSSSEQPPKFQDVFGLTLVELAEKNPKIVGVTPAMLTGSSMFFLQNRFPERTFDVGIAEQHAVTFSAGLAAQGLIPFCNIYSSFMQRALDQVIHDVALQSLPVIFCLDRAGLVGEDGATHHGFFDLAQFRCIPNVIIASPLNEIDLRNLMFTAQNTKQPFVIRYPRGKGTIADWKKPMQAIEIGKGVCLKQGEKTAIVSIGAVGQNALNAADILEKTGQKISVYDMRFLAPLDEGLLHEIFKTHERIITLEDGIIEGGLGSAVMEFAVKNKYHNPVERLGIPRRFVEQGTIEELQTECGFDVDSICRQVVAKDLVN
ncbi:MAG: 1-deoxy-D-xylulose-5-phosphate synthase [Bacteroidales bacterium]|nr:1-deoxy-D-xylulose-5-phosphate synthase [Bacteroidales bacterium]